MSEHRRVAISAHPSRQHLGIGAALRSLLVGSILVSFTACASRVGETSRAHISSAFPEVVRIRFRGNDHFGAGPLRQAMALQQRPLWPVWKSGDPYTPPTLDEDLRRLQKFYFDRGFLHAHTKVETIQPNEADDAVTIIIGIAEGLPTTVKAIHILGTIPPTLSAAQVKKLTHLPLRTGDRLTKEVFEQTKTHLLHHMQRAGYARAQVVPHTAVDLERHEAIVSFTLQPGALTPFGHISIHGARQVKLQAIRRRVAIRPGQRYSPATLAKTQKAIYDLGMFRAVTSRGVNMDAESGPLDIAFEVHERKPRTVEVSLGFSTVSRFRLQAEWVHRNLFHGAERFSLLGKISSIEQSAEFTFRHPYFFGRHTTFTQIGFVRNEEEIGTDPLGISDKLFDIKDAQPAFDLLRIGGETRIDHMLHPHLRGTVGLGLSLNDVRHVDKDALTDADDKIAEDNVLFVQFTRLLWDTSDNVLHPSRGFALRWQFEHANTAVLSDVSFMKFVFDARYYLPLLWRFVLATRVELGSIAPYGRSEGVPFNLRFFAGGPGSIRGFAINRVGPQNDDDEPIGGRSLLEAGAELRFPLIGNLGGAVFLDAGNVFADSLAYRVTEMRYAIGPGLHYRSPVGVVRLDVGFIMDRRTDENFGRIEFSIGQSF